MACDQSYFRHPNKKQGHVPEPSYDLRFIAPSKRQVPPHSTQRSLINLGPFHAKPVDKSTIHTLYPCPESPHHRLSEGYG